MHGGVGKNELTTENVEAIASGIENLKKHIETIESFGLPYVVAINKFPTDSQKEIDFLKEWCSTNKVEVALTDVWKNGGAGGVDLAEKVIKKAEEPAKILEYTYNLYDPLEEKIRSVAQTIYGADDIVLSAKARSQLVFFENLGWGKLPVCMAKTQYALSNDPSQVGRPTGFTIHIRELRASVGAEFIVVLTGDVMTMPGLPQHPAALNMDVTEDGKIVGLF